MTWLGLDIGGANLKAATADGWARTLPFALWRDPEGLASALASIVAEAPQYERLAITMTGELCDCFRTKSEGVHRILTAVRDFACERDVSVYLCDGHFGSISDANEKPLLAAASNWRAIAELACRCVGERDAILVDIGSTTTDIIPIKRGRIAVRGFTDTDRLMTRELVYSGVGRTPVCAVTSVLPLRNGMCPVAAELFSTTADVYLLLGEVCEDRTATWTADGRPLTTEFSRERLARQVCADVGALNREELIEMAAYVRAMQKSQLIEACGQVASDLAAESTRFVISGSGEFLARAAAISDFPACPITSLADEYGQVVSQCAAAFAVVKLAEEAIK